MKNLQGDIVSIVPLDSENDSKVNIEYDAWGKPIIGQTSSAQEKLLLIMMVAVTNVAYRSYFYDFDTGLYYLRSRYYDPETGRFVNADDTDYLGYDDLVISMNLFAYCLNNPVNGIDYTGNESLTDFTNKHLIYILMQGYAIWASGIENEIGTYKRSTSKDKKIRCNGIYIYETVQTFYKTARLISSKRIIITTYLSSVFEWEKYAEFIEDEATKLIDVDFIADDILSSTVVAILSMMGFPEIAILYTLISNLSFMEKQYYSKLLYDFAETLKTSIKGYMSDDVFLFNWRVVRANAFSLTDSDIVSVFCKLAVEYYRILY